MIRKYIIGNPFNTEAVVAKIDACDGSVLYFETVAPGEYSLTLADNDIVYGLGEQIRGINKRGWEYVNWNYDNPNHQEDTHSLYGSHNFIVVSGEKTFGAFFDFPGRMIFDIGYTKRDVMTVKADRPDLTIYIIEGESIRDIVRQFREIIGQSYVAPLWAFGYGQSRWGYKDEKDIREVADKYQEAGVPLDSIYMDIDYMDSYKDFTVEKSRFEDLKALADDMRARDIHLVPIIDAGVKIEPGYDVYDEGVANNYFCKNAEGGDFVGAVWPGKVHFPDFMNPKARDWFGKKYATLTSLGIDGFWNDMNEPANFYTEDNLEMVLDRAAQLRGVNVGIQEFFEFGGMVGGLNGNATDYEKFYHNVDGKMVKHSEIHNLYGMNMTRAANEALCEINPEKRTLFFSRSSYIGAHRYGGIWQGDNKSWWSHILQGMQQLPALNMAGFMFVGSDTGGFGSDTTQDLMMRWLQFAIFTPLMRNHSALGTRMQELYRFDNLEDLTQMIKIRYSLVPYLYSEYLKAIKNNDMMFRPLAFDFSDDADACNVEDQLLIGDELMIAPIYKQNANGRYVYLPEEGMTMVRMRTSTDYDVQTMSKGHQYVHASLNELVFFIRSDKAIPFYEPAQSTAKLQDKYVMLGKSGAEYELYADDGISLDWEKTLAKKIIK